MKKNIKTKTKIYQAKTKDGYSWEGEATSIDNACEQFIVFWKNTISDFNIICEITYGQRKPNCIILDATYTPKSGYNDHWEIIEQYTRP